MGMGLPWMTVMVTVAMTAVVAITIVVTVSAIVSVIVVAIVTVYHDTDYYCYCGLYPCTITECADVHVYVYI